MSVDPYPPVAGAGSSYTDEQAQDAVGTILTDSATLDFTYDDATPSITGIVKDASLTEAKWLLEDVTTLNASTTAHGLLPKLSGTATEYLNGSGTWSTPAGAGSQPLDATLTALAGLATGADQLPYATGTDTFAQTPLTGFARTLLDDTTQAAMRTTLGLTPGTDVQAQDAELQAIAGLTSAADRLPYFTGLGTASLATFTAAGRNLVDDADNTAQRATLGLGTLATQNANAVAITGGSMTNVAITAGTITNVAGITSTTNIQGTQFVVVEQGGPLTAFYGALSAGSGRWNLYMPGTADNYLNGALGIGGPPSTGAKAYIFYEKNARHGIWMQQLVDDAGVFSPVVFLNTAGTAVGSISTSASATSFNTSSDIRLKHAVATLAGALERVRALRPVSYRWNVDDSPGIGFLAHELQQHMPEAVAGFPDEVNDDGSIKPQQVDHSRILPWTVAALQELAARLDALEAAMGA